MRPTIIMLILLAFILSPAICSAEKRVVLLQDKQFVYHDRSVESIKIKKGDIVTFKNSDNINYEVFSESKVKPFKLGLMKPGASKRVVFDKVGEVEVDCALHTEMYLNIIVSK